MPRTVTRTSRTVSREAAMRGSKAAAATRNVSVATSRKRLIASSSNQHARREHDQEPGDQSTQYRQARETRRQPLTIGHLPRNLQRHLGDRAGAETEEHDRDNGGRDKPAHPRAGDRRQAAEQSE